MVQAHSLVSASRPRPAVPDVRAHLSLLKVRIAAPLVFVAAVTAVVASQGAVPMGRIVVLVLAGGLASAGAACLNHYLDRDIDAVMQRTRSRPIPSGDIGNPATAAFLGVALVGIALVIATTLSFGSLVFIALGAFFYVVVYTLWLKRSTPFGVIVGGFAGSCAVLAGWAAVSPHLSLTPLLLGLIVFLWTPAHFWSLAIVLKEEYRQVNVPMLPVLVGERMTAWIVLASTTLTVLASLLPYWHSLFGQTFLFVALFAALLALLGNLRLVRNPTKEVAWQSYKLSGVYLGLLFAGMLADAVL